MLIVEYLVVLPVIRLIFALYAKILNSNLQVLVHAFSVQLSSVFLAMKLKSVPNTIQLPAIQMLSTKNLIKKEPNAIFVPSRIVNFALLMEFVNSVQLFQENSLLLMDQHVLSAQLSVKPVHLMTFVRFVKLPDKNLTLLAILVSTAQLNSVMLAVWTKSVRFTLMVNVELEKELT